MASSDATSSSSIQGILTDDLSSRSLRPATPTELENAALIFGQDHRLSQPFLYLDEMLESEQTFAAGLSALFGSDPYLSRSRTASATPAPIRQQTPGSQPSVSGPSQITTATTTTTVGMGANEMITSRMEAELFGVGSMHWDSSLEWFDVTMNTETPIPAEYNQAQADDFPPPSHPTAGPISVSNQQARTEASRWKVSTQETVLEDIASSNTKSKRKKRDYTQMQLEPWSVNLTALASPQTNKNENIQPIAPVIQSTSVQPSTAKRKDPDSTEMEDTCMKERFMQVIKCPGRENKRQKLSTARKQEIEQVRKVGSCYTCKFSKRSCDPDPVCKGCLHFFERYCKGKTISNLEMSCTRISLRDQRFQWDDHGPALSSPEDQAELERFIDTVPEALTLISRGKAPNVDLIQEFHNTSFRFSEFWKQERRLLDCIDPLYATRNRHLLNTSKVLRRAFAICHSVYSLYAEFAKAKSWRDPTGKLAVFINMAKVFSNLSKLYSHHSKQFRGYQGILVDTREVTPVMAQNAVYLHHAWTAAPMAVNTEDSAPLQPEDLEANPSDPENPLVYLRFSIGKWGPGGILRIVYATSSE